MPLSFDLSLDELYTYQGTNPRPTDFDSYWDESLSEMRAVEPNIELVPAEFQTSFAKCSHLYFTGVGGARIHAKLIQPTQPEKQHPAVVMFHGYTGNSGDWQDKLGYAAAGFSVAALDCRGQGGLSEDKGGTVGNTMQGHIIRGLDNEDPKKLLFRQVFLDTAQLAGIVMDMPNVDETRVGAMGGSQGGALTLACSALEPRIKRAAPVFPFLSDYKRVWDMDLAVDAYEEIQTYFRLFDPRHEREEEIFTKLGYIDIQYLCPRIKAEVMMSVGLADQICPPSTQFAAYNKIQSPKNVELYPDFGHEDLRGHKDQIFQFLMEL
ncbi:MAG: acetylxylan esterase [Chloroflexota bacterium]